MLAEILGPDIFVAALIGLVLMFVPTFIAMARHRPSLGLFALVNLCVGWTGIGWLVLLVMALWQSPKVPSRPAHEQPVST